MHKSYSCLCSIFQFITFLFMPVLVNAQELPPTVNNNQSENTQAIEFHIIGGLAASYCIPILEQSQLRFTIDLALNSNTSEGGDNQTTSATNYSYYQDDNNSQSDKGYAFDFVASYIYLLTSKKDIRPFIGCGILGTYGKSWSSSTTNSSGTISIPNSYSESESNSLTWGIGLRGTLGCETFITSNVSMLAEYQISVLRYWTDSDNSSKTTYPTSFNQSETKSNSNGWQITLNSIRLGIAVHF